MDDMALIGSFPNHRHCVRLGIQVLRHRSPGYSYALGAYALILATALAVLMCIGLAVTLFRLVNRDGGFHGHSI